ncbi:WG repeat-containing protein [Bradyrhizobium stylosanthis]|uniref:WG repeat protein n=1 Tax=Bradyrhizobium stylosanthis TaxID=1803665 RepID=A0A560DNH5_9BRAD|nr:WG repeat-containing protein [Bradyrhizobium stylosanthis]TWA98592.1 WG repeat protein [Bradyrhizobium stylosanthis]
MRDILKLAALLVLPLLSLQPVAAADQGGAAIFDCWEPELDIDHCAASGPDGRPRLTNSYLSRLRFDSNGLARVLLYGTGKKKGRWFYTRRGGPLVQVETYDNGPDDFVDGRARSPVGGKVGYVDRNLDLVIPAIYDGAYPFEKGLAVVCRGCAQVSDGSHHWYEGGEWGRIDPKGQVIAPFLPWEMWKKVQ